MNIGLGSFGDERLQKGGSFCGSDWLPKARVASGFARWAEPGRAKCGVQVSA